MQSNWHISVVCSYACILNQMRSTYAPPGVLHSWKKSCNSARWNSFECDTISSSTHTSLSLPCPSTQNGARDTVCFTLQRFSNSGISVISFSIPFEWGPGSFEVALPQAFPIEAITRHSEYGTKPTTHTQGRWSEYYCTQEPMKWEVAQSP